MKKKKEKKKQKENKSVMNDIRFNYVSLHNTEDLICCMFANSEDLDQAAQMYQNYFSVFYFYYYYYFALFIIFTQELLGRMCW